MIIVEGRVSSPFYILLWAMYKGELMPYINFEPIRAQIIQTVIIMGTINIIYFIMRHDIELYIMSKFNNPNFIIRLIHVLLGVSILICTVLTALLL